MNLTVSKADAYIKDAETLTSGRAGLELTFKFSAEWEGLTKTAVFTANNVTKYCLLSEDKCIVPSEVLATPNVIVVCGVYGTDGNQVIIPTVYCSLGLVVEGTTVSGQESGEITPSLYDQVVALLNSASDELVQISETRIVETNTNDSGAGEVGVPSVSISYSWIDETDHTKGRRATFVFANLKGRQGERGTKGERGSDGVSPTIATVPIENGHKLIITDVSGSREIYLYNGVNGVDGEDGFNPIVSTETISGGHRVSITDKTHTEHFDVLNGEGSGDMLASVYDPSGGAKQVAFADELTDLMIYKILTFDGSAFKDGNTVLTFAEIKTLCMDEKHFVYAQYSNRLYIPQYVSNNNIFFQATYISSDVPQIHRISINNLNQVSQYNYNLAKDTDVPTKVSDLTNDSGYITSSDIPTNVSAFTNDAGYLTEHQSLANYYNKTEIDGMIGNVESLLASL